MKTLEAHFDGQFLVPHAPLELPVNQPLVVTIAEVPKEAEAGNGIDDRRWLRAVAESAVDFLGAEPEIYSATDGRPFRG